MAGRAATPSPPRPSAPPAPRTGAFLAAPKGAIAFDAVTFAYPTHPERPVLAGLTLECPAGWSLALVGASGCGKSTALALLQRLATPTAGRVLFDGVDVRLLDVDWYRARTAVVSQDAVREGGEKKTSTLETPTPTPTPHPTGHFRGDRRRQHPHRPPRRVRRRGAEGIGGGGGGRVHRAAAQRVRRGEGVESDEGARGRGRRTPPLARTHPLPVLSPPSYDTVLAERGANLSGGQRQARARGRGEGAPRALRARGSNPPPPPPSPRQRLAVARALIRDAKLLLLDEATSALDNESEAVVQASLDAAAAGRTTVTVAHRLAAVVNADIIAVLDAGRVVEQGTHGELVAAGGAYARLAALQATRGEGADVVREDVAEVGGEGCVCVCVDGEGARAADTSLPPAARRRARPRPAPRQAGPHPRLHDGPHGGRQTGGGAQGEAGRRRGAGRRPHPAHAGAHPLSAPSPLQTRTLRTLAALARPNAPAAAAALAAAAAAGAQNPAFAVCISSAVGALASPSPAPLATWCAVFGGLAVNAALSHAARGAGAARVGAGVAARAAAALFGRYLQQDVAWHDAPGHTPAALGAVLGRDAGVARDAVTDVLPALPQAAVSLTISAALALASGWRMTLVVTAAVPVLAAALAAQTAASARGASAVAAAGALPASVAAQSLAGLKTVVAYGLESDAAAAYTLCLAAPARAAALGAAAAAAAAGAAQVALFAMFSLAFWYGGRLVAEGAMEGTAMLRVFFALVLAAQSLADAQASLPALARLIAAADRLLGPADAVTTIESGRGKGARLEALAGEISLDRVAFAYPTHPRAPVFTCMTLTVPAGTALAVTGASGCGKSTVLSLISRAYAPRRGRVALDGVDVSTLDLAWYRSQMAIVSQEPVLFTGTVFDNVREGGKENKTLKKRGHCTRKKTTPQTTFFLLSRSRTAPPARPWPPSRAPPWRRTPRGSSRSLREGTKPSSAAAAARGPPARAPCPAGSASGWSSRARSCARPRSCCWTR